MPEPRGSGLLDANAAKAGSEDPRLALTASLLRRLLQAVAVVGFLYFAVGELFLFANKRGSLVLGAAAVILLLLIPEWLRRKGRVRAAAWTLVLGGTLLAAVYVFLSGGVRSPGCLFQIVLIQEATLLLGRRGALAASLPTLALDLAYVVAAALGERNYATPGRRQWHQHIPGPGDHVPQSEHAAAVQHPLDIRRAAGVVQEHDPGSRVHRQPRHPPHQQLQLRRAAGEIPEHLPDPRCVAGGQCVGVIGDGDESNGGPDARNVVERLDDIDRKRTRLKSSHL